MNLAGPGCYNQPANIFNPPLVEFRTAESPFQDTHFHANLYMTTAAEVPSVAADEVGYKRKKILATVITLEGCDSMGFQFLYLTFYRDVQLLRCWSPHLTRVVQ